MNIFSMLTIITLALMMSRASTDDALQSLLAPLRYPTGTVSDSWRSVTEDINRKYFVPMPKPTGALESAFWSWEEDLGKTCWVPEKSQYIGCEDIPKATWCALPSTLQSQSKTAELSAYVSYARAASTWLALYSSSLVELAEGGQRVLR
ncbi:hypothetical protein QBC38DRAFT_492895 [Podospora fimiseda]|uniref:DUF7735 domain-containing protein n=1 Tax=Podospora fimiseda TaxID=252190 RepID=A0AAN6YQN0_9PEZI|nr:hypothetical protein QBC38DRAFT_492895 [Podospora fimiseda]